MVGDPKKEVLRCTRDKGKVSKVQAFKGSEVQK
jgi:hypothetical protein